MSRKVGSLWGEVEAVDWCLQDSKGFPAPAALESGTFSSQDLAPDSIERICPISFFWEGGQGAATWTWLCHSLKPFYL